jgi:HK97 family phage portal protein
MLFKNLFRNETVLPSDPTTPQDWFRTILNGTPTAAGVQITAESSLRVSTVYACVNILANSVAKLPFQLHKEKAGKRSRDTKHAVAYLLETQPNPLQTPFIFKHTAEVHRNLWGNAYINIEWNQWGYPAALWLLNPAVTEPIYNPLNGELRYYTTLPDGKQVALKDTDVIHLKTLSTDGIKGKSMIGIARELIGSSTAAQQFKGKFYANGAANNGVLKFPTPLNEDAKAAIRLAWEAQNTGIENAHRIAILDAGLEFESIGMPLKDAQFIEGMQYDKKEIATIFNIPAYKLNDLEKATLNNIEQMGIEFLSDTLDPILTQWEEEFKRKLFSLKEQTFYYLVFALAKLMRTDSKTRAEFYGLMNDKGFYSINDVRKYENLDPIEGGDSYRVDLNHVDVKLVDEYQMNKAGALKGGEKTSAEETTKPEEPKQENQ